MRLLLQEPRLRLPAAQHHRLLLLPAPARPIQVRPGCDVPAESARGAAARGVPAFQRQRGAGTAAAGNGEAAAGGAGHTCREPAAH